MARARYGGAAAISETSGGGSEAELASGGKPSEGRLQRCRGRERPASSGQAPTGCVGEDSRPPRRERPLPPGSELQVLSSEAEGAGGAGRPEQEMHRSSCFEDEPQTAPLVATVSV